MTIGIAAIEADLADRANTAPFWTAPKLAVA